MSEFESKNQKVPNKKLRAGDYPTRKIKTSSYIPAVFETEQNKKWLDSTLDQLVSKAALEDIDGYIGDRSGKSRLKDDVYVTERFHKNNRQEKQLEPAIVNKDLNGNIQDRLSVDDIANSVALNFDTYAYSPAYNSQAYVMSPPIDFDKFVNHNSYYWMYDMPIYTSNNLGEYVLKGDGNKLSYSFSDNRPITGVGLNGVTQTNGVDYNFSSGGTVITFLVAPGVNDTVKLFGNQVSYGSSNIVDVINNAEYPTYIFSDDDNQFELQNGIIIRFGDGYPAEISKSVYIVTGVGTTITLRLYNKFETSSQRNIPWWVDYSTYKKVVSDFWDFTSIVCWDYKLHGVPDSRPLSWGIPASPSSIIAEYNKRRSAPAWISGTSYVTGDYVIYNGIVYSCLTPNSDATFTIANWTVLGENSAMCRWYNGSLHKTSYLTDGQIIRIGSEWPSLGPADPYQVYYVEVDQNTGLVSFTTIIGARVKENISNITQANPAVVTTVSPHGLNSGDFIRFDNVGGMAVLNGNKKYYVKVTGVDTFELYDDSILATTVDTTSEPAYTGGGYVYNVPDGNEIEQFIANGLTQTQLDIANTIIGEWDTEVWDRRFLAEDTKDYHVISTNDPIATQWSRGNWWVHKETIVLMETLIPNFSSQVYFTAERQARRPIIEFQKYLHMWNHQNDPTMLTNINQTITNITASNPCALTTSSKLEVIDGQKITINSAGGVSELFGNDYYVKVISHTTNTTTVELYLDASLSTAVDSTTFAAYISGGTISLSNRTQQYWHGPIDFLISNDSEVALMADGSRYIKLNDRTIYMAMGGVGSPTGDNFDTGDTCLIFNSPSQLTYNLSGILVEKYRYCDVYWNGSTFDIGQRKRQINQAPLFRAWDYRGNALEDTSVYPASTFTGTKIFGYQVGTGTADNELGFPLVYKDVSIKADYCFENFLHTIKVLYPVETSIGAQVGANRSATGMFSYSKFGEKRHIYKPAMLALGARDKAQYTIEKSIVNAVDMVAGVGYTIKTKGTTNFTSFGASSNDIGTRFTATAPGSGTGVVIPDITIEGIGSREWATDREILVYRAGDEKDFTVAKRERNGYITDRRKKAPALILETGITVVFHDLINDGTSLKFWDKDKNLIPVLPTFDQKYLLNVPSYETVLYYGYSDNNSMGKLICVNSNDFLYHTVYINGKALNGSSYDVNTNSIVLPAAIQDDHNIIDIEYMNSNPNTSGLKTQVADTLHHNSTNEMVKSFTITETMGHWRSLLRHTPGFTGNSFGFNNYHKTTQVDDTGGEIFMHNDISIMHDLNYANDAINLQESLYDQANDYWGFKKRFINQITRLYKTNASQSVREIVNLALKQLVEPKRGRDLHKYSNMVYYFDDKYEKIEIVSSLTVRTNFNPNSDRTQGDHLYVYLTDNINSAGTMIERLLIKDVDYTLDGSKITLTSTPIPLNADTPAYITVYWHDMDYECYVPASMTKLGLSFEHTPAADTNRGFLLGHDGDKHDFDPTSNLYDMTDPTFDVVTASLFELEKRIWAGIVENDNTKSALKYIPGQHRPTWYTLDKMNDYMEQLFASWQAKTSNFDLTPSNYYQSGDDTTWNYKTTLLGEHFDGNALPGHWKGAYTVIFGTSTPHLTPWHMLGISRKPDWWDTHYPSTTGGPGTWGDSTKVANLITALRNGIVTDPTAGKTYRQDVAYARYYWDWASKFPVQTTGTNTGKLRARSAILGVPSSLNASQEFEFGDWGPVEILWRESVLGQSALVDAALKLRPTEAWTDFFQPGSVTYTDNDLDINKPLYYNNSNLFNPRDVIYSGKTYNKKIKELKVKSSTSGWGSTSTINLVDGYSKQPATAKLVIENGQIKNVVVTCRGVGIKNHPVIDIVNSGAGADSNAKVDIELLVTSVPERTNGINELQINNLHRHFVDLDLENTYYTLDTMLMHKLAGFSSKNLLNYYLESGRNGMFRMNDNDYELLMYTGKPTEVVNASNIIIKKSGNSYKVQGFSSNKQNFKFYQPIHDNNYSEVAVAKSTNLRKYTKFESTESVIDFRASLAKIQDLYDFIRGNRYYLETKGITFQDNADAVALDVARWAMIADDGEEYIAFIGDKISYTATHGYVLPLGSLPHQLNDILDQDGNAVDQDLYIVDRKDDLGIQTITVTSVQDDTNWDIGSVGFAEIDFEHVALFKNTTQFNDIIFNDKINARALRMKLQGQRTKDWDGNRKASGYLIFENKIVENWDSSVKSLGDFYNFDIENVNPGVTKSENIMLGNYNRQWHAGTNLSNGVLSKLWQGSLKDKGTSSVVKRYERSDLVHGGDTIIDLREEWMFRQSYMGDTININAHEIQQDISDIKDNKQIIDLSNISDARWVNNKSTSVFETIPFEQYLKENFFKTGGEVLNRTEARYKLTNISELSELYDLIDDNLIEPSWNGQTSYKLNDVVRYKGQRYKCAVDSIGYTTQATDLVFLGTSVNPTFDYASQAAGDPPSAVIESPIGSAPVSIWFDTTDRIYNNIVAIGSITNPSIASGSTLTIDTVTATFTYTPRTAVVDTTATDNGNPSVTTPALVNPVILDNTGKTLIINGNTINLVTGSFPAGSSLTRIDIANIITASDPSGNLTATDTGAEIKILYNVNSVATDRLIIGNGTANTDLGLTASSYSPALIYQNVTSTMTAQIFADRFNDGLYTPAVTGQTFSSRYVASVDSSNRLVITKQPDATSSPTDLLGIGGTVAAAAGFTTSYGPVTYNDVPRSSNVNEVANFITGAGIPNIQATTQNNRLLITCKNSSINFGTGPYEMNEKAGIPYGNAYKTSDVITNEFYPVITAGEFISGRRYVISTIGTTDFTTIGASSNNIGVSFYASGSGSGTGTATEMNWYLQSYDPLRFNIQISSDNAWSNADSLTGSIKSKFNGWNVFKPHNLGWYTGVHAVDDNGRLLYDTNGNPVYTSSCSICAGTATEDGNDACINIHPDSFGGSGNIIGSLEVGDYVMIVNSTSSPSVDGIHKVTKLGNANEPYKFFIDMFIDECGASAQVFVLRNCRFETKQALIDATADTARYKFVAGDIAWTEYNVGNTRGTYVWKYDGNTWSIDRQTTSKPTNSRIESIVIYDAEQQQTQVELEVYDPISGIIPGIVDREINSKSAIDHAVYTHSTALGEFIESDQRNAWGEEEIGNVWWDTSKVIYYDYNQGSDNYKKDMWGRLYIDSLPETNVNIHVYEWTKSNVLPDEWEAAVEAGTDQFGQIASGTPYSVYDSTLNENVYYYSEQYEYNTKTGNYDPVYYFWVRNRDSLPPNRPNRHLTTDIITKIIVNPTKQGIQWCAAIDEDKFIIANVGQYLNDKSVIQINKKLKVDISKYDIWQSNTNYYDGVTTPNNQQSYIRYKDQLYKCITDNTDSVFDYSKWELVVGLKSNSAHDSWLALREGKGTIPEYWYKGLLDNIVGEQQTGKFRFPNLGLHKYNRYGDDRKLGQGWYLDTFEARRQAVSVANSLLKNMNLYTDLGGVWDRHLGSNFKASDIEQPIPADNWVSGNNYQVGDVVIYGGQTWTCNYGNTDTVFNANRWDLSVANPTYIWNNYPEWESSATRSTPYVKNDVVIYQNFVYQYRGLPSVPSADFLTDISKWTQIAVIQDQSRMWDYVTYVHPDRLSYQQPSIIVNRKSDVDNLDKSIHNLVQVKIRENGMELDEILKWTGSEWLVVEKKNATIEFNDTVWRRGGWDSDGWDTVLWDTNGDIFAYYFVVALRHDIFINQFKDNFNKFFFEMVKYVLATQKQVDWVYKTTYVQLDIKSNVETTIRRYRKNGVNELIGYIESLKPFHTKIRTVFDRYNVNETAEIGITEQSINKIIKVHLNEHDVIDGSYEKLERSELYGFGNDWTELSSTFNDNNFAQEYVGADFTDTTTPTTQFTEKFLNGQMYNERNTTYRFDPIEHLRIVTVTEGTSPLDRRTFVYLQDNNQGTLSYSLQESLRDELAADFVVTDTQLSVVDGTKFKANGGYAYIGGEIIRYGQVIGNDLLHITREENLTSAKTHVTGTNIIDITDTRLSLMNRIGVLGVDPVLTADRFNDSGKSILDVTSANLLPKELQSSSQGIEL